MFLFTFLLIIFSIFLHGSQTKQIPNSCIDQDDGSYWLQLKENENDDTDYPAIYAKCSNGYTILDYNYDNNLKEYFTSWNYWHYAIAGPNNGDIVNWEQWYLGSDDNTKYLVSPDCTTCDETSSVQYYNTKTAYWITGNMFGCWWDVKGFTNCDLDFDTYTCYYCGTDFHTGDINPIAIDENSPSDYYELTGQCATSIQSSDSWVPVTHENCTSQTSPGALKPSLGISGKFCVCVQPSSYEMYDVDDDLLQSYEKKLSLLQLPITNNADTSSSNIIELYAEDFTDGTYRILTPGTYKIMEDIDFEFNIGDVTDPFAEGSWWPSADQADVYPGAGGYRDQYFLGFFAGITIETSDVVLDLNGHILKMTDLFYFHQRWFSIIELASQYFLPGQGPGFMGYDPQFGSNVVIKNGVLGLSSHFGIHGNFNDNVQILDVKVRDFETHGIQLNGWTNVVLSNVDIGPSSTQAYLRAEFGHARVILPRLRKIADENPDGVVQFTNRESMSMNDIADVLETQMQLALDWALTQTVPTLESDEMREQWTKAKSLFINEDGIPFSSSLTGLFLNLHATSVFTFNLNTDDYSTGAKIENVKIHDLHHSFEEWISLSESQEIYVNTFTAPMDLLSMIGEDELDYYMYTLKGDFSKATYKGHALTDAYIAMNLLSDNWNYLGGLMIKNSVTSAWAQNKASFYDNWNFACNVDAMLHSGKGILGFRMDGVKNVDINGLEIFNLFDQTPLGRFECGNYSDYRDLGNRQSGGHFRQLQPIQVGFSGNMVLALSISSSRDVALTNINIHDLESETGLVDGVAVWTHCTNISFHEGMRFKNFTAGSKVKQGTFSYSDRPNKAPEACAFKIQWDTILNEGLIEDYTTTDIRYDEVDVWEICDIQGHVGCDGDRLSTTELSIKSDNTLCSSSNHKISDYHKAIKKVIEKSEGNSNSYVHHIPILPNIIIIASILFIIYLCKRYGSTWKMNQDKIEPDYGLINNNTNRNYGSIDNDNVV